MQLEDDDLKRELDRMDPNDLLGWISLIATLFNIAYSIAVPYYTFDLLISTSFLFGVLSIMHNNRWQPKLSLALLGIHLVAIAVLRMAA